MHWTVYRMPSSVCKTSRLADDIANLSQPRAPIRAGCIGLYIVSFAFSLGPVVWLMISEIFPNRARARAAGISTAANWTANFLVSLSFPVLQAMMGPSLWFLYAAMGVVAFIFIVGYVPETKGKSL